VVSLAKSSLCWEWRRYLPVIVALAFSTLLIHAQVGLALGWFFNRAAFLRSTSADLLVSNPALATYEDAGGLDEQKELPLRLHPEVRLVQPQVRSWGQIRANGAEEVYCIIYGLKEPAGEDLLAPPELLKRYGAALQTPMTIVLEKNYSRMLGIKVGDHIEINNQRVTVVGLTELSTMLKFYGLALASMETLDTLTGSRHDIQYFLVKLKHPERAAAVGAELMRASPGKFRAWTRDELFRTSQYHALFQSHKSLQIIFSTILSALIGIVITNQSLRGAILASLREYAAIRALGVSRRALNRVILEQSFWLGLIGVAAGLVLTGALALAAAGFRMPFYIPWTLTALLSSFILAVALGSGMLAMRVLYHTQPAELLR